MTEKVGQCSHTSLYTIDVWEDTEILTISHADVLKVSQQFPALMEMMRKMDEQNTTSGTGFSTELSRSFNDFFGTTSNASNQKIDRATKLCMTDLRIQCVKLGGNAVISTDIDFNEIGSGRTNMLIVCMVGKTIKVNYIKKKKKKNRDYIVEVIELTEKLEAIAEMNKN